MKDKKIYIDDSYLYDKRSDHEKEIGLAKILAKKGGLESQLKLVNYYKELYSQKPNQIDCNFYNFLKYLRLAEANNEASEELKRELQQDISQMILKLDQTAEELIEMALDRDLYGGSKLNND